MGEYLPQEQDDAEDVLAWLAEQPWCTGRVGMIGISWGGFNGLQVAARRPPQLGCVVSLCSTDDRYADDVHYMGGALLGIDMLAWASTMLAYNSRPPDPEIVGEDRWREMWLRAAARDPAVDRGLGLAPAPRRVLEAGLGVRRLRRAAGARVHGRRLERRLHECDPALSRGLRRAAQGPDRPVVAQLSRGRHSQARRSASSRRRCAGSTTGCATARRGSWTSRSCVSGCRSGRPRRRVTPTATGAGYRALVAVRRRSRWRRSRSARAASAAPTPPTPPCAATRTTRTAPMPATGARTARPPTSRPTSARRTGARCASTPTR